MKKEILFYPAIIIIIVSSCTDTASRNLKTDLSTRMQQESILVSQTSREYVDFLNELEKLQMEFINNPTAALRQQIKLMEEEALKKFPEWVKTGAEAEGEIKRKNHP